MNLQETALRSPSTFAFAVRRDRAATRQDAQPTVMMWRRVDGVMRYVPSAAPKAVHAWTRAKIMGRLP